MKGAPIGIVASAGVLEEFVEMIAAFGRADEESAALTVGQGGADDFGPNCGLHRSAFVQDDEIETAATETIGFEGAIDDDGGIADEINAKRRFAGSFGPMRPGEGFETIPNDVFRLIARGAEIPNERVWTQRGIEHFGDGEISLAEATTGD